METKNQHGISTAPVLRKAVLDCILVEVEDLEISSRKTLHALGLLGKFLREVRDL